MAKYLVKGNYTQAGLAGLREDGGTGRREAVEKLLASVGGTVESIYYAFGDTDVFVIVDMPDNATAAGVSLKVSETGMVTTSVTVLLTPEEIDVAVGKSVDYRPPGG